jgi:hypothetical protein
MKIFQKNSPHLEQKYSPMVKKKILASPALERKSCLPFPIPRGIELIINPPDDNQPEYFDGPDGLKVVQASFIVKRLIDEFENCRVTQSFFYRNGVIAIHPNNTYTIWPSDKHPIQVTSTPSITHAKAIQLGHIQPGTTENDPIFPTHFMGITMSRDGYFQPDSKCSLRIREGLRKGVITWQNVELDHLGMPKPNTWVDTVKIKLPSLTIVFCKCTLNNAGFLPKVSQTVECRIESHKYDARNVTTISHRPLTLECHTLTITHDDGRLIRQDNPGSEEGSSTRILLTITEDGRITTTYTRVYLPRTEPITVEYSTTPQGDHDVPDEYSDTMSRPVSPHEAPHF